MPCIRVPFVLMTAVSQHDEFHPSSRAYQRPGQPICAVLGCAGGWLCGCAAVLYTTLAHTAVVVTIDVIVDMQQHALPADCVSVVLATVNAAYNGGMPAQSGQATDLRKAAGSSAGDGQSVSAVVAMNDAAADDVERGSSVRLHGRDALVGLRLLESLLPNFHLSHAEHALKYVVAEIVC